ncbi:hypothetical protein MW871_01525 [Flavobacterium sp. I-SCBP12n]|uniref:Uncharacterized protein n=1 Tax=Flavobacterium pygoscelis TaxID=2893176 RepID=A0A9X1XS73_9FLAO|nr:hypothetical protein [Flavobacterium pygoscelis]MCK8140563.1 hypothetical protein [Flavobacterium pygoscelis]
MKTYIIALFLMVYPYLTHSQVSDNSVKLKQINIIKTNFRNLKSGEIVNKTILFNDGKIQSIKTSDVIQSFFYNPKGLLDMTVKERQASNWKEVVNYTYNNEDQLVKFVKKYEEGGELVTKTVAVTYEGSRVKAITKKSNSHQTLIDDIEYVVENGLVARRSSRDRNKQIFNKIEYVYFKDNIIRHKVMIGDKSMNNYTFDDKNSADLLIVQNLFGKNYKVIVPLISFHEDEFALGSISVNNELSFASTALNAIGKTKKYKYNTFNYPSACSIIEENGIVKTEVNYLYE